VLSTIANIILTVLTLNLVAGSPSVRAACAVCKPGGYNATPKECRGRVVNPVYQEGNKLTKTWDADKGRCIINFTTCHGNVTNTTTGSCPLGKLECSGGATTNNKKVCLGGPTWGSFASTCNQSDGMFNFLACSPEGGYTAYNDRPWARNDCDKPHLTDTEKEVANIKCLEIVGTPSDWIRRTDVKCLDCAPPI